MNLATVAVLIKSNFENIYLGTKIKKGRAEQALPFLNRRNNKVLYVRCKRTVNNAADQCIKRMPHDAT